MRAFFLHATNKLPSDLANHLDLKPTRTKEILAEMLTDGIIDPEGQNKNRTYKLK